MPASSQGKLVETWLAAAAIMCLALVCPDPARAESEPQQVLHDQGLKGAGSLWLNRHELHLRQRLDSLPELEKRCAQAWEQVQQFVERNEASRLQFEAAAAVHRRLGESASAAPPNTPLRRQRDEDAKSQHELVKKLQQQFIAPDKFGEAPPVKAAVVRLNVARDELVLALLSARDLLADLPGSYESQKQDPAITAALAGLGPKHALGPKTYRAELKYLAKLEDSVLADHVPMHRESGRYRISAIVNEQVPATFTYRESGEPTVISHSLAQAAGIEAIGAAPRLKRRAPDGRELEVRLVKIPQLRIGKFVLRDVEAQLLPPDAEDLGAQLGERSISGYQVEPEPHLLRFRLKAN